MKKIFGFIAVAALLVSLSTGVNIVDNALDETHPRPLVVQL